MNEFVGDNKEYFANALEWYLRKYLSVVSERAWLCLSLMIFSVFLVFLLWDMYSMFPTRTDFSFVKYTDRYSDEFLRIKRLSVDVEEKEEDLLSAYLAGEYVKRYESYSPESTEAQLGFVKNNSSRRVFVAFRNMMERGVVIHPLLAKYKTDDIVLEAVVDKVELLPHSIATLSSAVVEFRVKHIVHGVLADTEHRKVFVSFSLSNIRMAAAGVVPFEFTINSYRYVD
ncbi:MAG: VirB8/TrbF family protein [Anaplasma sp.]